MDVVVMLADIVDQPGILVFESSNTNLFNRMGCQWRILQEIIAIGDIGHVVFVMVKLERFARHKGRERIIIIGKVGQFEGHGRLLLLGWERV
jgi:hypothetical protein